MPAHGHLAESDLLLARQRIAHDDEAFRRDIALGRHVIGLVDEAQVDVAFVDELHEVDRVLAFELDRVEFVGLENDVGVAFDLVALDDVLVVDRGRCRGRPSRSGCAARFHGGSG